MAISSTFRSLLLLVIPATFALLVQPALSQASAAFTTKTTAVSRPADHSYAVDVNNDGITDLVSITRDPDTSIAVNIANGDGTFKPSVFYQIPANTSFVDLVSGDFNGDGKVDLLASTYSISGSGLVLLVGNGDGTFQAPKTVFTLPNGQFTSEKLATADFNSDGKLDVVMEGYSMSSTAKTSDTYYLLEGNGTGGFSSPRVIYSVTSPSGYVDSLLQATVGDFDGDAKADIALISFSENSVGGQMTSKVHVFYGDGAGNFTDVVPSNQPQGIGLQAGDLNSDGRTDIFGFDGAGHLDTMYGQASRTFTVYTTLAPSDVYNLAMGDFNGDGRMDLVSVRGTQNPTVTELVFFLATTTPGDFTQQTYSAISQQVYNSLPIVGDFNGDGKPDVIDYQWTYDLSTFTYIDEVITDVLNTTASGNWGSCAYPKSGQGIHVCTPAATATSPVTFSAAANSYGQLRKIELWVDGKKLAEQWHTWGQRAYFTYSAAIAAGTHSGVIFAADVDNRLQKSSFSFTVGSGSGCAAPSSPGVNVCAPANGSTVSSPVHLQAASKITGTLARMEIWVDGVKKYTETTSTSFNTTLALASGSHRFTVFAVNTAGTKWEKVVTATVK